MSVSHGPNPSPIQTDVWLLERIGWNTYEFLLRDRDLANDHFRITYDQGMMQIDRRGSDIVALDGISQETYQHLLHDLDGQHLGLMYDQGRLRIEVEP